MPVATAVGIVASVLIMEAHAIRVLAIARSRTRTVTRSRLFADSGSLALYSARANAIFLDDHRNAHLQNRTRQPSRIH
jgi:hypothetical protein